MGENAETANQCVQWLVHYEGSKRLPPVILKNSTHTSGELRTGLHCKANSSSQSAGPTNRKKKASIAYMSFCIGYFG